MTGRPLSRFGIALGAKNVSLVVVNRIILTPEKESALQRLLDDPSPGVRQALLREFEALGGPGVACLRRLAEGENRVLGRHAAWFLRKLRSGNPAEDFRHFVRSLNYELETGFLLLNRTVQPDLDIGDCCRMLDAMARRCRDLMFPPMSARERCRVINRVLFHEYHFRGNVDHFEDPANSLLGEVLHNRRGLPVTLSVVYILVAQRCGFMLEPVGIPGHFLVGCYEDVTPFFIDPFAQGLFRSPDDVFTLIRQHKTAPRLSHLTPTPVREVIWRCCRNLVNHYGKAGDEEKARLLGSFAHEFEITHQRSAEP